MVQPSKRLLTATEKVCRLRWGSGVVDTMRLFSKSTKRGIFHEGSMELSKQLLRSTVRLFVLKSDNSPSRGLPISTMHQGTGRAVLWV